MFTKSVCSCTVTYYPEQHALFSHWMAIKNTELQIKVPMFKTRQIYLTAGSFTGFLPRGFESLSICTLNCSSILNHFITPPHGRNEKCQEPLNTEFPQLINTSLLKTDVLVITVHWENIGTLNGFQLLPFYAAPMLAIALK